MSTHEIATVEHIARLEALILDLKKTIEAQREQEYVDTAKAMEYLNLKSKTSFRRYCERHGIAPRLIGGKRVFSIVEIKNGVK